MGANLSGANLYWTDLSKADLGNADLSGANLNGTDLSQANLSGADFAGVIQGSFTFEKINDEITHTSLYEAEVYEFGSENFLKILNRLDDNQLIKILGIGDEVPASEYLKDLAAELGSIVADTEAKTLVKNAVESGINKILGVVISLEEKIKPTTPSSNTRPLKRGRSDSCYREGQSSGKRQNTSGRDV